MSAGIERLLAIASEPLAATPVIGIQSGESWFETLAGQQGGELVKMLAQKNGFYAFESALLVRPFSHDSYPMGIVQWNGSALWRSEYKMDLGGIVFFAEDVLGAQFCIKGNAIHSFEPETGELKIIASSFEDWVRWVLEDSKIKTAWPLAHFWQLKHGPLKPGTRLLPKVPFVLGGQFAIENLYELNEVEGMRFRASIANQLHDCPDGSKVVLKISRH